MCSIISQELAHLPVFFLKISSKAFPSFLHHSFRLDEFQANGLIRHSDYSISEFTMLSLGIV
ncbi:hypothetical protein [Aquirufa beregesia]|uniref:hypothetical protein n=1 Tax=Aquirufa beregesia TaxID=2516556 RepID=UPI00197ADB97|nr:hypothetical protein [Aquirufa beregesia]